MCQPEIQTINNILKHSERWNSSTLRYYRNINRSRIKMTKDNGPEKRKYPVKPLCGWKCLIDKKGQKRLGWLVWEDRRATVTQSNHLLQPRKVEYRLWQQHLRLLQLRLTKIGTEDWNNVEDLSCLTSLDFICGIQV